MIEQVNEQYQKRFGGSPAAAAVAPGRVELLGNHTDYNGGYVMSAAIDRLTVVAGEPILSGEIRLYAANFDQEAWIGGGTIQADPENSWASYVLGVTDQLRRADVAAAGFQAVIESDVPVGSGLSSSAALEVATALFLQQLFPYKMDKMDLAKLCQRAENEFVGVSSGLMDQFSSVFGRENSLLFLDCLTYEHETIPLHRSDAELVICNSMVKHALTGGDYNTRRGECMAAAAHFGKKLLREVSLEEFEARKNELPENQRKRAEHILRENQRVLEGRKAAAYGDLAAFGKLMSASHASSRDLFENSAPELDFLVETALSLPGCYGARLTGGGWGGATINLVDSPHAEAFRAELAHRYEQTTGIAPEVFACRIADGARTVELS
jgi:galactokinase